LVFASLSAPASNKSFTVEVWPLIDAQMSAVQPAYADTEGKHRKEEAQRKRQQRFTIQKGKEKGGMSGNWKGVVKRNVCLYVRGEKTAIRRMPCSEEKV